MKRIVFISTFAFLCVGTSLWVSQSYVASWEPRLRSQLEERLGTTLGARVHIENISLSFIHRIALRDIEIWDTQSSPEVLVFRAKEVSLTLSLIDLPRALYHHNPLESIGLISVDTPLLSLSPEFISRQKGGHAKPRVPPWFEVEWDHGTFQWKDPQAPHGTWTLYQSGGLFRIRGPHMDGSVHGALEQAESVDLHFSSLVHHWNAQGHLAGGDVPGAVDLIQRFTNRTVLPEGWKAQGRFNLDVKAAGRWPLVASGGLKNLIQEARLTLNNTQLDTGSLRPPLQVTGGLYLKESRLDFTSLTVKSEDSVFKISGHFWPFTKTPQADIQAASPQADLALLTRYLSEDASTFSWLRGIGSLDMSLKGPISHPNLILQAKLPHGQIGRWPFQNANLLIRRHGDQWDISPSTLRLWDGNLTLKGTSSKDRVDLQLTGDDMALQSLAVIPSSGAIAGRLNFSLSMRGPMDNLDTAGSYWINNLSYGRSHIDSVRGDLDVTSDHFELNGASEDDEFHLGAEGSRTSKTVSLQQFQIQLPSGASLSAHGSFATSSHRLHLALDAENVSLPDDIPYVQNDLASVKGTAELHGRLDGPLSNLVLRADIQSHQLQIGDQTVPLVTASLHWTPVEFGIDSFHMEPGYSGSFHTQPGNLHPWDLKLNLNKAPSGLLASLLGKKAAFSGNMSGALTIQDDQGLRGDGNLNVTDATFGNVPVSQAWLQFNLQNRALEVQRLSFITAQGKADFKGRAMWEASTTSPMGERVFYHGEGRISSLNDGAVWSLPCHFKGQLNPKEDWKGGINFEAPMVKIHNAASEPLSFRLNWDSKTLMWDDVRLGNTLMGEGSWHFAGDHPQWSSQIKTRDSNLALWESWFWPTMKEPVQGALSGTFTLSGSPQEPLVQFSGNIHKGHWRAFQFENSFEGTWRKTGLEPLAISGTLPNGGQFHFQGRVSNTDETASGSLELTQIDLHPFGESLSFPHPLEGKANGTFTVSGPLDQLHLAGHLEGTSLVYGKPNANPLKLQSYVMDLKLDPVSDRPNVIRMTVTQAVAKTLEEEIRLNPGSFVEFAGSDAARMQIGTEIRNLHLGVFTLFGGVDISGTWQIKPEGFALQGDLYTRSLYINDYQLEQGHVNASYYNGILSFAPPREGTALVTGTVDFGNAPQLKFKDFVITGNGHQGLHLSGDIGPGLWNFSMEGQGIDIGTLSGLGGFPYPLQGSADVKIHGTGDLEHPRVEGTVDVQNGQVVGLNFKTGSAAFIWQGHHMTFTRLVLSDPGRYTLTGAGVFPLATKSKSAYTDKTIDFSARLVDSNLGLLQSLSREVKQAKGSVQALLQIKGTTDAPNFNGYFRVKNGDVDGAHYFRHLRDFQLAAEFGGNDLVINEFSGKSGKGEFSGGGHIVFSGFVPKFYDLHMTVPSSKGIEVTVPELAIPESPLAKNLHFLTTASQSDVKGRVTFRGPADAPVFFGQAYLSNGHFTFPPSTKNPPPPGFMEWIRRISWDVDLHFSDEAWFENELVEANLNGSLHLKGPSDRFAVDGGMDILEGKISYLSLEFNIRQARFDIRSEDNGSTIVTTPYVRGIAESIVPTIDPTSGESVDDTITLTIDYAPVNEIKPRLASSLDPTLPQDKLLARVSQLDVDNLTPQERTYLYQQQMVRLIDTSLATPLANNLLKRTGLVDELRVSRVTNPTAPLPTTDPSNPLVIQQQNSAANLLAGTKYTLAKNLTSRLSLGYGLRFDQILYPDLTNRLDLRSDIEMSYRFISNIYLRGSYDLPTTTPGLVPERKVTIEPRWRFGWWGNTNKPKPTTSTPTNQPQQSN